MLALQGAIQIHGEHFRRLGIATKNITLPKDLSKIDGLVLPGGESTTMFHLIKEFHMKEAIQELSTSIPFWGICAGAILMSSELEQSHNTNIEPFLKIFPVRTKRNAYGRQLESFSDYIQLKNGTKMEATFIRAPSFLSWEKGVEAKAYFQEQAVYLENEMHMVTSFHPELSSNSYFHKQFLKKCEINLNKKNAS